MSLDDLGGAGPMWWPLLVPICATMAGTSQGWILAYLLVAAVVVLARDLLQALVALRLAQGQGLPAAELERDNGPRTRQRVEIQVVVLIGCLHLSSVRSVLER